MLISAIFNSQCNETILAYNHNQPLKMHALCVCLKLEATPSGKHMHGWLTADGLFLSFFSPTFCIIDSHTALEKYISYIKSGFPKGSRALEQLISISNTCITDIFIFHMMSNCYRDKRTRNSIALVQFVTMNIN